MGITPKSIPAFLVRLVDSEELTERAASYSK